MSLPHIKNFLLSDDTCRSDEFTCANKHCIQQLWVCDNDNDCGDNSDEKACRPTTCHPDTDFACSEHYCITSRWRCDGDYDCPDRSDEIGCKVLHSLVHINLIKIKVFLIVLTLKLKRERKILAMVYMMYRSYIFLWNLSF